MRFSLEFRDSVRAYLRDLPLTREGKVGVNAAIIETAREVSDSFRLDPANRTGPGGAFYHFRYVFMDGGRARLLYVVIDDSTAAFGVLRVVYADCQ